MKEQQGLPLLSERGDTSPFEPTQSRNWVLQREVAATAVATPLIDTAPSGQPSCQTPLVR